MVKKPELLITLKKIILLQRQACLLHHGLVTESAQPKSGLRAIIYGQEYCPEDCLMENENWLAELERICSDVESSCRDVY